jgi:opacity protein-like surface antigen
MRRVIALVAILAFSNAAMAQKVKKTVKKPTKSKSLINNEGYEVELGLSSLSAGRTGTISTNHPNGQPAAIGGDNSGSGLRIGARRNFYLGDGLSASTGLSLIRTNSTATDLRGINPLIPTADLSVNTETEITQITVEQRVSKYFSFRPFKGFNLRIRPFAQMGLTMQDSETRASHNTGFFNFSNTANTTNIFLTPTIGTEFIITSAISAELSLTQSRVLTKGNAIRVFSEDITTSSTDNSASLLNLGVTYRF